MVIQPQQISKLTRSRVLLDGPFLKSLKYFSYSLILLCTVFTMISCHRINESGIKSKTKADSTSKPNTQNSSLTDNGYDKQVEEEEVLWEDEWKNYRDSALAQYIGLKYFTTSCKIRNGKFELEVVSKYSTDTIHPDVGLFEIFNTPIVLDQKLVFKKGKKTLKVCRIPNTHSIMKNSNGKNIKVYEYSISGVELLKGSKSNYFMVYATKKCLVGSECYAYTGLYNMNGNFINEPYSNDSISIDFDSPIKRKRVNFFWGYSFDSLF